MSAERDRFEAEANALVLRHACALALPHDPSCWVSSPVAVRNAFAAALRATHERAEEGMRVRAEAAVACLGAPYMGLNKAEGYERARQDAMAAIRALGNGSDPHDWCDDGGNR